MCVNVGLVLFDDMLNVTANVNCSFLCPLKDHVSDKFRFITFCVQYAAYLVHLILSVIPEQGRSVLGYRLIGGEVPSLVLIN